jgi:Family of unknown function (DUF6134)
MAHKRSLPTAAIILGVALCTFIESAHAATQVYTYAVEHPTFGRIGTFTNIITQSNDRAHIVSHLHVAIRILGFDVYRQDAIRTEEWHGDQLTAFQGVTTTNGKNLDVSGHARGNTFVITTPDGTVAAPADIRPSNPWSPLVLRAHVMMSTRTGKVERVRIVGGGEIAASFDGRTRLVHRYVINGRKRGIVWFDNRGVPVAFEVWEQNTPIRLVLVSPAAPLPQTAMAPH